MEHTFKFDTTMWYDKGWDSYFIEVSTTFLGMPYRAQFMLSPAEIRDAKFDILGFYIKHVEYKMAGHLAKISSS